MACTLKSLWLSLLLLLVLVSGANAERDSHSREREEVAQLAVGRLLVAMPHLRDPRFQETVVLLADYGSRGAMGLVLNRPTALDRRQAFDPRDSAAQEPLFFGGPVQTDRNLVLMESEAPVAGAVALLPGLYLLHKAEDVERLLQDPGQKRFRLFSGYAGWGPQQLEHEIYQGDWLVLPAHTELIMESLPEALWPRLIRYSPSQIVSR